jgi:hypothetical protein
MCFVTADAVGVKNSTQEGNRQRCVIKLFAGKLWSLDSATADEAAGAGEARIEGFGEPVAM